VGFRPGRSEISPRNRLLAPIAERGGFVEVVSSGLHVGLSPQPGDVVLTKRRVSAFAGIDLDVVLRAAGIETPVLAGIATRGSVLSPLRQAGDLDFSLTVLPTAAAMTTTRCTESFVKGCFRPSRRADDRCVDQRAGLTLPFPTRRSDLSRPNPAAQERGFRWASGADDSAVLADAGDEHPPGKKAAAKRELSRI
jgi:Isochorismatase family